MNRAAVLAALWIGCLGVSSQQLTVEAGDEIKFGGSVAPVQLDIASLMQLYSDPGLSVAVISRYHIAWAKGYGVTAPGGSTPVTAETLFQAGSISKPVAAIATLRLVQSGKLALDENVNLRLRSWHVPENAFTADSKVTLRRILSHTSGLTVHGFDGYDRNGAVPTLEQILDGKSPATNVPVRVDVKPGTVWRYSGGAAEVEQQLLTDVTGVPFPQLLDDSVLQPIGMRNSTYTQPLPDSLAPSAADGTYFDGMPVKGGWQIVPQLAAAGLWTTPSDLARCAIEIALSKHGRSNRVLNREMATLMLSAQVAKVGEVVLGNGDYPDRMGLGFFLGGANRPDLFGHIGDDPGFQAMLEMYADSGSGVAIMGNSQNTIVLGDYLIEHIAREYGWPNFVLPDRYHIGIADALGIIAMRSGISPALAAYAELKKHPGLNGVRYALSKTSLVHLTYTMHRLGRDKDALTVALLESNEYPTYWNAFDTLGEMYADLGEKAAAIAAYRRAIELNPDSEGSKEALLHLEAPVRT